MTKVVKSPLAVRSAETIPSKQKIRKPSKPEAPRPTSAVYGSLYRRIIE